MNTETQVAPDAATEIPASEVVESPEVTTPEAEAEVTPVEVEEPEDEASKALKRMQRRIDKRTADVYRERARAEQLAQRVAELEARTGTTDERANEPADPRVLAREIARQERLSEKVESVIEKGRGRFNNFDTLTKNVAEELGPSNWDEFRNILIEVADNPENVVAYLGNNLDIAADLIDLSPLKLAKRLDRIEREIADKSKPKPSSAPKPLDPIKPQGSSSKDPSRMTDREFADWRHAQIKTRGIT